MKTKKELKEIEKWVDIIREWNYEPYPPIRPLAKKVVKALQDKEKEMGEELRMRMLDIKLDANDEVRFITYGFNKAIRQQNNEIDNYLERKK